MNLIGRDLVPLLDLSSRNAAHWLGDKYPIGPARNRQAAASVAGGSRILHGVSRYHDFEHRGS